MGRFTNSPTKHQFLWVVSPMWPSKCSFPFFQECIYIYIYVKLLGYLKIWLRISQLVQFTFRHYAFRSWLIKRTIIIAMTVNIVIDLETSWLVASTPLKNMKVSWDGYSKCMENKSHVPNHQPDSLLVETHLPTPRFGPCQRHCTV